MVIAGAAEAIGKTIDAGLGLAEKMSRPITYRASVIGEYIQTPRRQRKPRILVDALLHRRKYQA
jgi:hypothetical protein